MLEEFVKQFSTHQISYIKITEKYFLQNHHLSAFLLPQAPTLRGLFLGKEQQHHFIPSCNLLDLIAPYTQQKIVVNELGELDFLYGRHLRTRHVITVQGSLEAGTAKLVQNKHKDILGYGIFLGQQKNTTKILTHCVDRGIFIQRDKQLKK